MEIHTKHDYYIENLIGTDRVLCKESAAEFLNLSNGNFSTDIYFYSSEESFGKEIIIKRGIKCTSINQTINDLLMEPGSDGQILLESLSNYYYEHNKSFEGLVIKDENMKCFIELRQDAIDYYND